MADARLHVTDRLGRRAVPIDKSPFTIGRGTDSDLRLSGGEVSRDHAEILRAGDHYVLHDRGSRYGTFVGGEPASERVLVEGDRIRLGRSSAVELVFLQEPEVATLGAESLVEAVRQTAALLEGLRALGAGHLLQDVLVLVLDAAIEVSGADRGFIMLAAPGGNDGKLEFTVGRGRGRISLEGQTFKISRKIPEDVFARGESRIVADLVEDDAADTHMATVALGIRQVLCVPLKLMRFLDQPGVAPEPTRIGVLYLDSRESGALLADPARIGVETLATEAAVAIENARLYRETVEKARVDQELRIAAEMQKALRPPARRVAPTFEIAAASKSSRSIGGDFFDYIELPDGAFGFALGDVAGKGPPAAVLAAALQGMFAAYASGDQGPADTLTRVNVTLLRHFVEGRFATMVYGILTRDGRLIYSNAGHNPPMLFTAARPGAPGLAVRRLEEGGVPLGLFPDAEFLEETLQLHAGDVLVLFSDGVSEAANAEGEAFGDEGVIACVSANPSEDPPAMLNRLLATTDAFSGGAVPQDDVTSIILRYKG
jgi:phosphoserine phosphatase RsbU/P